MKKYNSNKYYRYINDIQEYGIRNPEWFWSDLPKAREAREWLYNNNANDIIEEIYKYTPDTIKSTINPKKLPTETKIEKVKNNIYKGQKKFIDTAGAISLTTAPLIPLGGALISSPIATLLGIAGGVAGGKLTDNFINKRSNGKYNTFGEYIRKGENKGETLNTLTEFLNPGAIIGGTIGGVGGRFLDTNWSPALNFNPDSGYRIIDKKGFDSVKNTKKITSGPSSTFAHFTLGKPFVKVRNGDYLIETKIDPKFHFGRYDKHLSDDNLIFTDTNLSIGEGVTPVVTERNVPINLDVGKTNIYKKIPLGYWKKNIKGSGNTGEATYGNIKFIRNTGDLFKVEGDKVILSPDENILTNLTYDQSFRLHKNYRTRSGEDYIIISPKAFVGKKFGSIEPMDSFTFNEPIDKKYITFLSGNRNKLKTVKNLGIKTIHNKKLVSKYGEIMAQEEQVPDNGIVLTKRDFGHQDGVADYDKLANQIIKDTFGEVDFPSVKALENATGLSSGVTTNFKKFIDWNVFKQKAKFATIDNAKDIKFKYPNGREINGFSLKGEIDPTFKVDYSNIFYDPSTHAENNLLGISKPKITDLETTPWLKTRLNFKSFPLLGTIK